MVSMDNTQIFFPVMSLGLHVTKNCNLRCKYCYFVREGSMTGQDMTFDIARQAIDGFIDLTKFGDKPIRIGFFGGEPLENFELIREVVLYCRKLSPRITFRLSTNCVSVTSEIAQFLFENKFAVLCSIDGPRVIHNQYRVYKDGSGSFDDTISGMMHLRSSGVRISVLRATFGPDNSHLVERLKYLHVLHDMGYGSKIDMQPYVDSDLPSRSKNSWPRKFTIEDVEKLKPEAEGVAEFLARRMIEGKHARFHGVRIFIHRLRGMKFAFNECAVGRWSANVGVDGNIYACFRGGNSDIGNMSDGIDEVKREEWLKTTYTANMACLDCEVFGICGGHCRYQSLKVGKNIDEPDPVGCAFRKLWIATAREIIRRMANEHKKRVQGNIEYVSGGKGNNPEKAFSDW